MQCDPGAFELHTRTASEAARALDVVTERMLAEGDANAAFADIYSIVTHEVEGEVGRPGAGFLEPAWTSRLAGRFCARYLQTLRWEEEGKEQDCEAWGLAYAVARTGRLSPLQGALLGLSAHINHDLAFSIHATILELGHAADPAMLARYLHDHDRVNSILCRALPEAFERLIHRHRCRASALIWRWIGPLVRRISMRLLRSWRAQVWRDVLALLAAATSAERAAVDRRITRRSARVARLLSLPLRPPGAVLWLARRAG
ncbi:MAG: hypothetical protein IT372_24370 [Polyangiaceae bacterium]|nr:hypothetical protein [Polyangiaceae bacterium]